GGPAVTSRRSASSRCDLGQRVDETVDVLGRALLGDRDEQRVVHALVVAAERVSGMDAAIARGADDVACAPSDAYAKRLECCLVGKQQLEAGLAQALSRVPVQREAGLPRLA